MRIYHNNEDFVQEYSRLLKQRSVEKEIIFLNSNNYAVCCGRVETYNQNRIITNGLYIFSPDIHCGTTVVFPGDLSFIVFTNDKTKSIKKIKYILDDFCFDNNIEYTINKNDVIVNNKKCMSYAMSNTTNCSIIFSHISIFSDINLINKICVKPMDKIPGSLFEYGVTSEKILDYIRSHELMKE